MSLSYFHILEDLFFLKKKKYIYLMHFVQKGDITA